MVHIVLYHNPRCSKSRRALELLGGTDASLEVIEYLARPLCPADLELLISKLETPPEALVRRDSRFKELGLDPANYVRPAAVRDLLVTHPSLMQRPVAVSSERAVIGRPPERVLELLEQVSDP